MTARAIAILGAMALVFSVSGPTSPASAASSTAQINGDGSSWAANAILQWISDVVSSQNLHIVFTSTGSAQGRQDFAARTVDFGISDIGYQGSDPLTGEADTSEGRQFAYLPVVAGGTAFPYQIRAAGQLVTNLRLSGLTLAKIFTNQITNWDAPEITADNNGRQLPSIPIIPVVHSEGAGTTAQFTEWMATEYPSIWKTYSSTDKMTEYWPRQGAQISQDGSDGVMNFVSSSAANGAIGVDEYSYALAQSYPVAKIENAAGYFTAPTQYNVAVALTQAQINMDKSSPDYLLETLTNVYDYTDLRTYPLSSYSYLLEPTGAKDATMTTAKRQTLVDWMQYSICTGQHEIGPIGYSPLPVNLVEASFQQLDLLQAADPGVSLSNVNVTSCNNPTLDPSDPSKNELARIAPMPPSCDKQGAGPCTGDQGLTNGNPLDGEPTSSPPTGNGSQGSSGGGSTSSHDSGGSASSSGGSGSSADARSSGNTGSSNSTGSSSTNPSGGVSSASSNPQGGPVTDTGSSDAASSSGSDSGSAADAALLASPTVLNAAHVGGASGLYEIAAVILLVVGLVAPPFISRTRTRTRTRKRPS